MDISDTSQRGPSTPERVPLPNSPEGTKSYRLQRAPLQDDPHPYPAPQPESPPQDEPHSEPPPRKKRRSNTKRQGAAEEDANQADILIGVALSSGAEFWHTSDGTAYVDITVSTGEREHRETWPVRSASFRKYLAHGFYKQTKGAPNEQSMQAARNVLEGRGLYEGPEREIYVRVANVGDRIYLDLADSEWRAVEIDADGWRVIGSPPVRFRRSRSARPLPMPERGGTLDELRDLVNVTSDSDFVLMTAWLVGTLSGGPFPQLVLQAQHGAGKSYAMETLRSIIDPARPAHRGAPRDDRDLFIAAQGNYIIALDNMSSIPDWLSDSLCRLSTGGGFATRELHTDDEERVFEAKRPIAMTGITELASRADLADRGIAVQLAPIDDSQRRTETELRARADNARPRILGALLDAASCGLQNLRAVKLDYLPRMADFATWATACEPAMWDGGAFARAYASSREAAVMAALDADDVAIAVQAMMATLKSWEGNATTLLTSLTPHAGNVSTDKKKWPTSARSLSDRLRRAAPNLLHAGIRIEPPRPTDKTRKWAITRVENGAPSIDDAIEL